MRCCSNRNERISDVDTKSEGEGGFDDGPFKRARSKRATSAQTLFSSDDSHQHASSHRHIHSPPRRNDHCDISTLTSAPNKHASTLS